MTTFPIRAVLLVSAILSLLIATGFHWVPAQADHPVVAAARLTIPSIDVDTAIVNVGLTVEGDMAVPDSTVDVGWFSLGTRPGETGSAVIAGHNYWDHRAAVFDRLDQLNIGDVVFATDSNGVSTSFVVRDMRLYDPSDAAPEVFESENGIHLNLITCSGSWDPSTQSFTKRLVVFTDKEVKSGSARD